METPSYEELRKRVQEARSKDDYDDRHACCWQGYLAALLEWGLITPNEHLELSTAVPTVEPDPSLSIFLG